MVNDFYICLYCVCKYFLEDFCIYVPGGILAVVFFLYCLFAWFCYWNNSIFVEEFGK